MDTLKNLFRQHFGVPCTQCLPLAGGGSSRRYYRLLAGDISAIGTVGADPRENEAFFAYTSHLLRKGIRVPQLLAVAPDRCHYLQQDLGDTTLYALLRDKRRSGAGFDAEMLGLYRSALADLHAIQLAGADIDFSVAFPRPAFDRRAILWDLNYFKYFFLKLAHIPFDEDALEDDFGRFADYLLAADCRYFMFRDFQGRNIMLHPSGLHYIDYQGGRRGAAQYDVASLLYSAKSDLPDPVRRDLLRHYVALHGDPRFMDHFWGYLLLRIMQTLGAYGYRGYYERKPYFLESIPLAVANMRNVVEQQALPVQLPELQRVWHAVGSLRPPVSTLPPDRLTVTVGSFSYKRGLPDDDSGNGGGFIFDCRALPNPGRYEQYRTYTGLDGPVVDFLRAEPAVDDFLHRVQGLVAQSIDCYLERRFNHLAVHFGCTGGQHRSVFCAEQTARWIAQTYPSVDVVVDHREIPSLQH